jgi:hypothetical protein
LVVNHCGFLSSTCHAELGSASHLVLQKPKQVRLDKFEDKLDKMESFRTAHQNKTKKLKFNFRLKNCSFEK